MLGLFDQPVPREVFDALIAPPAIPGLTDGIAAAEVRATQWNEAIARLREQGLISPASAEAPGTLDCHPLVREYFGQRLAQIDRTAFKAAHSRLYDHYRYAGLPAGFPRAGRLWRSLRLKRISRRRIRGSCARLYHPGRLTAE